VVYFCDKYRIGKNIMAVFVKSTLVLFDGAYVPFGDLTREQQSQVLDAELKKEFNALYGPQPNTTDNPVSPATNPQVTVTPVATVPVIQERTSANAVPNTATTFTTPVIFDQQRTKYKILQLRFLAMPKTHQYPLCYHQ